MHFLDRKEFTYDPSLSGLAETAMPLKIHREYTTRYAPRPYPKFFEVDRDAGHVDDLWHVSLEDRTHFARVIDMPCLVSFTRNDWKLTPVGLRPFRQDKFVLSNLILQELDYFPNRGDLVFFNGYRLAIVNVVLEPQGYWGQTNLWLGIVVECVIPVQGDARPILDVSQVVPSEIRQTGPLPDV